MIYIIVFNCDISQFSVETVVYLKDYLNKKIKLEIWNLEPRSSQQTVHYLSGTKIKN